MEQHFVLTSIGVVRAGGEGFRLELAPRYAEALRGLSGFSHLQVLWWFSGCDTEADRGRLCEQRPYRRGPDLLGVFATRSSARPNPIALSCCAVTGLDAARGAVELAYIDARDQSPVLDIKPYTPSLDRVERPAVPAWCRGWPADVETSGDFDWASEFNFIDDRCAQGPPDLPQRLLLRATVLLSSLSSFILLFLI